MSTTDSDFLQKHRIWKKKNMKMIKMKNVLKMKNAMKLTSKWGLVWIYNQPDNRTLNFSWRDSISSFTRWISCVWYSRIAPRICGRTNRALNREKIRNISFALRAVPSWSRRRAVMRVSTRSMRSSYLPIKHALPYRVATVTNAHEIAPICAPELPTLWQLIAKHVASFYHLHTICLFHETVLWWCRSGNTKKHCAFKKRVSQRFTCSNLD